MGNPPGSLTTPKQVLRSLGPRKVVGGIALLSVLIFLVSLAVGRPHGELIAPIDGVGYYVFLRSAVIDGDIDFSNEYRYFRFPLGSYPEIPVTPTGRPANKYSIGPALLWAPFFLAAHGLASAGKWAGLGIRTDGYSWWYQAAISIGSIFYGTAAFAIAYPSLRKLFSEAASLGSIVLFWLASNVLFYMSLQPSMPHMISMFAVSLLLTTWFLRIYDQSVSSWTVAAVLGAAGGLVLLVRIQDAIILILPLGYFGLRLVREVRKGNPREGLRWLGRGALAGACAMAIFVPQILVWQRLYGSWTSPYLDEHAPLPGWSPLLFQEIAPAFNFVHPEFAGVLFSGNHGLFSWHPIYLVAFCGLFLLAKRNLGLAAALISVTGASIYLVASWWAWHQGASFGGRMFIGSTWIWLLGLACASEWMLRVKFNRLHVGIGLSLLSWNALSMAQYVFRLVPHEQGLTLRQMTIERLLVPVRLLEKLL